MRIREHYYYGRKGAALLMVLLVIGLLSGIVFTVLVALNNYAELERSDIDEVDALVLAHRGMGFGCHPLVLRGDPLLEYESADGAERYSVSIVSESSRLDINRVLLQKDKVFLRTLFTSWGMDFDNASALVDALVDWVDMDENEELNGAERDYYSAKGFSDMPYNRKFNRIKDMVLVKGFSELVKLKPDWEEYFTLWSGEKIDIYESKEELLAAATSMDRDSIAQFKLLISGSDGELGTSDDKKFSNLDEAFDLLGLQKDAEIRKALFSRIQLRSKSRRVRSVGEVSGTKLELVLVIQYVGKRVIVKHSEEKIIN